MRFVGQIGTIYQAGVNTVKGSDGVVFDLVDDLTIGSEGYGYVKVESQTQGENTVVEALTLDTVEPIPLGHEYVINEYNAVGGRDIEDDDTFRERIKKSLQL